MSYLEQDLTEFNHFRHLVLLYGESKRPWTREQLKYYAAHLGADGAADDWLFDSFLFINPKSGSGADYVADVNLGKSMSGEGDFFTVCSPNPADKTDWNELLDFYFAGEGALASLDRTIEELSGTISPPKHRRNVILTLPYPHITQAKFGELEKADGNLNFSTRGQDLAHATQSRLKAETWFVDEVADRWGKARFKNINLLGVYWIFETVYRSWEVDDHFLLKELRKHINSLGLKFLWIPFYATYNFHLLEDYERYYFDLAFVQPNFLFYKNGKDIETASAVAKGCHAGIEMEYYLELDEPISIRNERHVRFREYLNAGVKYGYMSGAACAHFQGVGSLERMYSHGDAIEREFYEDIYRFVKGTYEIKPYPPAPASSYFVPKRKAVISLDLGGTNLRMGVVEDTGKIVHWKHENTPATRKGIVNSIISKVEEGIGLAELQSLEVTGIGMSTGGRVNFETGVIEDSTSLIPDWKNVHVKEELQKRFNIPVFVDNDGNCSALAEKIFGRAKYADNFISMVLGTGIGGGIYVGGKLLRGKSNYSSEIGHITVNAEGPECSCGGCGCVELYASGSGLVRWAKEDGLLESIVGKSGEESAKAIAKAALSGNSSAVDLLTRAGEKLGSAVAGLVNIFNPSMIVFSGSLVNVGNPYFDAFRKTLSGRAMKPTVDEVEIAFSDFPQEVGLIGAAALAFEGAMETVFAGIQTDHDEGGEKND